MTPPLHRRSVGLMVLAVALSGCDSLAPDRVVLLPISALDAPASVEVGETIVVHVTVVSGGCRSFRELKATRTTGRVTFRAVGRDASGPAVSCPADIRTQVLEHHVDGRLTDPFTLVAVQPSGDETTRTVRVIAR